MPIKYEDPANYRYGNGRHATIMTMQDPDDVTVGGGVAGEVSDNILPFPYKSLVLHITALAAGTLPVTDGVYIEVSNDGTNWYREVSLAFAAYGTQEVIFEEIKFRFVRSSIDGTAVGSYLITAFGAE